VELLTLGKLALAPTGFTQPKPLTLLAYLVVEGPQTKRHMAELFWPDGNQLKSLSMALSRLRQAAPGCVDTDGQQLSSALAADILSLATALDGEDADTVQELYAGEFLAGVDLSDLGAEVEEWAMTQRERWAERVRAQLLRMAEEALSKGHLERTARLAADAYRLPGAAPAAPEALLRMHRLFRLSHHEAELEVRGELEELGVQVVPEAAAPVAALVAQRFATSFVGRETELAAVESTWSEGRILTLLGPGGSGKTRLALEVARRAEADQRFPDGVYVALLDDVSEPTLLPDRIAHVLGLRTPGTEAPWEQLSTGIADRRLLLVLDSMESLAAAKDDISVLVATAPGLHILLTSRERLGIVAERTLVVGGLTVHAGAHDWSEALRSPAMRLLVDRTLSLQQNLDLPSQAEGLLSLCRALDGLPLGLELAAPLLRLLPASALADRIGLAPQLVSVLETSWSLLSADERDAMARLSVFTGGFRAEAAEIVADVPLGVLAELLDHSWLRASSSGRLDRHQHLYDFTRARLDPVQRRPLADRHAAWAAALVSDAVAGLRGPDQLSQFQRLDEEHANLLKALDHLEETGASAEALTLATDLAAYWELRGYDAEGLRRLGRLSEHAPPGTAARTLANLRAARLAERLGRDGLATSLYEGALIWATTLNDPTLLALAHLGVAVCVRQNHGDYPGARLNLEAALAAARESGDELLASDVLRALGMLVTNLGEYENAVSYYEEAGELAERSGDELAQAQVASSLSAVMAYMREDGRARYLNERALASFRRLGDRLGEATSLANMGTFIDERGDARECKRLYRQSLGILRQLGDPRATAGVLNNLASVCDTLGEYEEARDHLEESLAWLARASDASLTTHALYLYGVVLLKVGDLPACRRRLDECMELCRRQGESWALMRALLVMARWHLKAGGPESGAAALACVHEAETMAREAGDIRTLTRAQAMIIDLGDPSAEVREVAN